MKNIRVIHLIILLLFTIIGIQCNREYDCYNQSIAPIFIGFTLSDIDTIVVRRFKMANNYQNLIDTFVATPTNSYYNISNDSTIVSIDPSKREHDIKAFYDWQIFLPSQNRTIMVSDISSEKTTGERSNFMETVNGYCTNRIFSMKLNNQVINFSDTLPYFIHIQN